MGYVALADITETTTLVPYFLIRVIAAIANVSYPKKYPCQYRT